MERIKFGTLLRRDLYEELKAAAPDSEHGMAGLIEQGVILVLRQQALARFKAIGDERASSPRGTAAGILATSRRDLEQRAPAHVRASRSARRRRVRTGSAR